MAEPRDREQPVSGGGERPEYTVYRSRPRLLGGRRDGPGGGQLGSPGEVPRAPRRRRFSGRRILLALLGILGAWLALSLVLFLISAEVQRQKVSEPASEALSSGGYTLTSANTILVLGSDARVKGTKEPGADVGGPSRSDSILLLRSGGGSAARLSIPRDTVVDIPGHGRQKINAAYAIGGPALAIRTIESYLGLQVNHLVEVNFENFPDFIDALGGIDYESKVPVLSKINGGRENGGYTLKVRRGDNHLNGKKALALARTRKNLRRPNEDDLVRARRQQEILGAIRSRIVSPGTVVRLPWVSWAAPQAIRSDMGGPSLLGLFGAVATGGSGKTAILRPTGGTTLPDGEVGLVVSDAQRQAAVRRFLRG